MKLPLACLMLAVTSTSACATVDLPPPPLRDKGKTPSAAVRRYELWPAPVPNQGNTTCHMRLTDPYFGYLSNDSYLSNEKAPFTIRCLDATSPYEGISDIARYDKASKRWVKDTKHLLDMQGFPIDQKFRKDFDRAVHFYPLSNISSQGFAYTQDAITGDEDSRERVLHYCLVKPPKALCGQGVMGSLNTIKKSDLTSYALKILRSIEFIEDESPPSSVDAQASPQ